MCGISGIFNVDGTPVLYETLKAMTDSIAHRGPDGEGYYIDDCLGFGHRRLAIVDLSSAGKQPMQTSDGRYVISYNGEIYNYRELRNQLITEGYQFCSSTDTEVVLNGYAHWGIECLKKFNGMFAFALWDKKEKKLTLARDRYGIKPLYYTLADGSLVFASEIKAIIASKRYTPKIDREALIEYLTFQNFFTDRNLFKDIRILQGGHYLQYTHNSKPKITQYWDFNFSENSSLSEADAIEGLSHHMENSVKRQLMGDVPINVYLSGGIDSGLITLLAAKQVPNIRSFTVGFDLNSASGLEVGFDEREKAEYISYLAKTEHYEMVLKAGDMERCIKKLTWALEEPRVGQCYPNFYAAKLASSFGKVVLSGTGGDEIFAGYPWRYFRATSEDSFSSYVDQYYKYWQRLISNVEIQSVCKPIAEETKGVLTRSIFEGVFKSKTKLALKKPEDFINSSLYFEAKTFLQGLLIMEDKLSMHYGLETRVPFLDNDLVDFGLQIPLSFKLKNNSNFVRIDENQPGKSKYFDSLTHDGKRILRQLMKKYAPQQISDSKKQGFSAPDASWFKGESIDYVKSIVWDNNSPIYNYLDPTSVRAIVDEHMSDKKNRRLFIWSLIYLHNFFEIFKL